jgi:TP901 family phage tail tape measure protein
MPGYQLAEAFVRLKVDSSYVAAETSKGIEKGASAPAVVSAGKRAGATTGSGFASSFTSALRKEQPAWAREGDLAGKSWSQKFGSVVGTATAKLGKVGGLALAAGLAASVKTAADFQAAMKRIQTQAGASSKDVAVLSKGILGLRDVQQGPIELANAMYHLKSVGLDNASAMKALAAASKLAAVGGANLEDTTNAIAGAWRSGIRGAANFGQAAATVNAIIGAGNMRLADFNAALGTGILPAARTFGLSLKQVGAALALMTDEGIPAQDAATRLRMSFSLLGAPSAAADKQLHAIGLSGLQLAQAMRGPDGLIGAITLLKTHLDASGLSASKQAQILSRAFGGGRSSSAILTLINNLDTLRRKQDQVNNSTGKFGAAVAAQQKTASAQLHILGADFQRIGIVVGTKLLPIVTKLVGFLAHGDNVVPLLAVGIGVLTAATIAWGIALNASLGGAPLIIGAIVAGVVLLAAKWGTIWHTITSAAESAWGLLRAAFASVVRDILGYLGLLLHGAADAFGWVPGVGAKLKTADRAFQAFGRTVVNTIAGTHKLAGAQGDAATAAGHHAAAVRKLNPGIQATGDKASTAAVQVQTLADSMKHLNTQLSNAIGPNATFNQDLITVAGNAADLTGALKKSGGAIGLHTAAQRSSFSTAQTYITNLVTLTKDAGNSQVKQDAATGAIKRALPQLQNVQGGTRAYWQEVRTLVNWLDHVRAEKAIHKFIVVTGNGSWRLANITTTGPQGMGVGRAAGGFITGGVRGRDSVPAWLMPGEVVVPTAMVKAGAVDHLRGRLPGFATGGIVPTYDGGVGGLTSWARRNDQATVSALTAAIGRAMARSFAAVGLPGGHGAIGGGVQRWAGLVLRVLGMLGQPAGDLGTVLSQMTTESGGNPVIVNRSDSNWAAGTPSVGLMQVIGPTFAANAGPFRDIGPFEYGVSVNPLANIYAGLNYAIRRYGASWTSVLGHGHGYAGGGLVRSYDTGGWLPTGLSLSYNGTGKPEKVSRRSGRDGPLVQLGNGDVYIRDRTDAELIGQRIDFALTTGAF